MKRILALILICTFVISGCSFNIRDIMSSSSVAALTEQDSVVKLDIYPEDSGFEVLGLFDRPEYGRLSSTQQSIYIRLDNALFLMTTGYIDLGTCTEDDLDIAYHALINDRPEYFWVPSTYYFRITGQNIEVCFAKTEDDWLCSADERRKTEKAIKAELKKAFATLDEGMSQYEVEVFLHDWLLERVAYDEKALVSPDEHDYAWGIDGAFTKGMIVCEGYAEAMQLLLFAAGIECGILIGDVGEPHAWNVVKINGHWYHLDPTHDDTGDTINHFFFNISTERLLFSRSIEPLFEDATEENRENDCYNTFLPSCTSENMNYHVVNSLYIGSAEQVESTVVSQICDAVRGGRRSVEFAVASNLGFVFGETDAADFFNLTRCVSAANAELPKSQHIRTFTYSGAEGALGFAISW